MSLIKVYLSGVKVYYPDKKSMVNISKPHKRL